MTQLAEKRDRPKSLTDMMRALFKGVLDPISEFLLDIGLTPNALTLIGLLGNTVGAFFLARGDMLVGGLIIFVMVPLDALDGTMARLRGEPSAFGAFVDSVTDRYTELITFMGLLFHYLQNGDWIGSGLVYLAASGSVLVSYVRARAEALEYEAKVGIMTRFERYLVLIPALVFNIPKIGIGVIALLAHITALHRIIHVRRQAHEEMKATRQ